MGGVTMTFARSLAILLFAVVCFVGAAQYKSARPAWQEKARFARWLVHESNFSVVASSRAAAPHVAFPNVVSMSDGSSYGNCTGHIYLYFASMFTMFNDIQRDPTVTVGVFEAGNSTVDQFCVPSQTYDPEDPNCAKVHLTGKLRQVANTSTAPGKAMAQELIYWRHPAASFWPSSHGWLVHTLDIERIDVLDFYGGAAVVP